MLRAASAAMSFAVLCAVSTAAQQTATFRGGVSLVTIDVTVLDREGRPVPALTPGDFDIRLDGKAQPIRALAFVQAAPAASIERPPAAADAPRIDARATLSNRAPSIEPGLPKPSSASQPATPVESRVFVLVIDDLSFSPLRGKAMMNAARRFLSRVPASDAVGFMTTSGAIAVNPTRSRGAIAEALSKIVGHFNDPRGIGKSGPTGAGRSGGPDSPLGISEAIDIERGDDRLLEDVIIRECFDGNRMAVNNVSLAQLLAASNPCPAGVRREARQIGALMRQNKARQIDSLRTVMQAMKGVAGIRHMVLISDGLPVSREVNDLHPLARAAAEAGVQLSVLMEDPDISVTDDARGESMLNPNQTDIGQSRRRRDDDALFVNGLQTMTDMLGGTFHRVIGTPDPFFERVLAASSAVYRLGIELPANAKPGDVFDVTATVRRPGVSTRVNRFTVAVPRETAPVPATAPPSAPGRSEPIEAGSIDERARRAVERNTPASAIPIRIAAYRRRSPSDPGMVDVNVSVAIPPSAGTPLNTYIGVVDAKGGLRSSGSVLHASPGGYDPSFRFALAPGDYRIRFAAANDRGEVGSVELPLPARLETLGQFAVSDVLTWYVSAGKAQLFALEDIPPGADPLRVSVELYPPAGVAVEAPAVRWSIAPAGQQPVQSLESTAQPNGGVFRADASFATAELAPGRYVVRAEIVVNGQVVGARAAYVVK